MRYAISTGFTIEETEHETCETIGFHLEGLAEDGLPIPHQHALLNTLKSWLRLSFTTAAANLSTQLRVLNSSLTLMALLMALPSWHLE
ncbi:MAG: hypothetical protein ABL885_13590 [Methylophilaceae bacterium]